MEGCSRMGNSACSLTWRLCALTVSYASAHCLLPHADQKLGGRDDKCKDAGKTLALEEAEAWIQEADVDGNGVVDLEEFEHCTRKAFSLPCSTRCTICCMNAMTNSSTSASNNSSKRCPKAPSSPARDASGGESMLKQRLRLQIKDRIKGSQQIKGLASSMYETEMLHKELEQMASGFRRTYSAPSPTPGAAAADWAEAQPSSMPEEHPGRSAVTGQDDHPQNSVHKEETDAVAPSAATYLPALPPPRFISAAEVALMSV